MPVNKHGCSKDISSQYKHKCSKDRHHYVTGERCNAHFGVTCFVPHQEYKVCKSQHLRMYQSKKIISTTPRIIDQKNTIESKVP